MFVRCALAVLFVLATLPTTAAADDPVDTAAAERARGKALVEKWKTFDDKLTKTQLIGVYLGLKYVGTIQQVVTRVEHDGAQAYKVVMSAKIDIGKPFKSTIQAESVLDVGMVPISMTGSEEQIEDGKSTKIVSTTTRGEKAWSHVSTTTASGKEPVKTETQIPCKPRRTRQTADPLQEQHADQG